MLFTKAFAALAGFVALASSAALPEAIPELDDSATLEKRVPLNGTQYIGPFALQIISTNTAYNGLFVGGIHIGAGIDLAIPMAGPAVGPSKSNYYSYYLDTSYGSAPKPIPTDPLVGATGTLQYPMLAQNPTAVTANLQFNTSSNRANLLLSVLTPTYGWTFDKTGRLGITDIYTRWYVCKDVDTPYRLKTGLVWKLGEATIDRKAECDAVQIKRKYLK